MSQSMIDEDVAGLKTSLDAMTSADATVDSEGLPLPLDLSDVDGVESISHGTVYQQVRTSDGYTVDVHHSSEDSFVLSLRVAHEDYAPTIAEGRTDTEGLVDMFETMLATRKIHADVALGVVY